jgi:hypothetical protein
MDCQDITTIVYSKEAVLEKLFRIFYLRISACNK